MQKITKQVGKDVVNLPADVKLIQNLLNQYQIPGVTIPLKVDGRMGPKTMERIGVFQKKIVRMFTPDYRIDPNGKTIKKLMTRPGAVSSITFDLSAKGMDFLKSIEKLRLKPYDDQTGKDITSWVKGATIGYGHLIRQSEWIKFKDGMTEPQAVSLLDNDLARFKQRVRTCIKVSISQNQYDALVMLAFNIGEDGFSKSSIVKLINNPSAITPYNSQESAWKAWNKSDKKFSQGVLNRRIAEWNIFTKNVYQRW